MKSKFLMAVLSGLVGTYVSAEPNQSEREIFLFQNQISLLFEFGKELKKEPPRKVVNVAADRIAAFDLAVKFHALSRLTGDEKKLAEKLFSFPRSQRISIAQNADNGMNYGEMSWANSIPDTIPILNDSEKSQLREFYDSWATRSSQRLDDSEKVLANSIAARMLEQAERQKTEFQSFKAGLGSDDPLMSRLTALANDPSATEEKRKSAEVILREYKFALEFYLNRFERNMGDRIETLESAFNLKERVQTECLPAAQ